MKNRTGKKRGMLFGVLSREFFDVLSSVSDSVSDGEMGSPVLKWVPVLDRYSAICVYGAMDICIKASGVIRRLVVGIPKKASWVYGVCSRRVFHRASALYGSVKYFFQVGYKALRNSFVDNPEYDAFGV